MRGWRHAVLSAIAFACVAVAAGAASPAAAGVVERTIFVPATVIYPGDEITQDALTTLKVMRPAGADVSFGERQEDLVGKIARRTLVGGQPVPPSALRTRDVIMQGRTYKLIYRSDFVTVVGSGVPLKSASAGEIINVRNPDTGIIVKARVNADQTLAIEEQ